MNEKSQEHSEEHSTSIALEKNVMSRRRVDEWRERGKKKKDSAT